MDPLPASEPIQLQLFDAYAVNHIDAAAARQEAYKRQREATAQVNLVSTVCWAALRKRLLDERRCAYHVANYLTRATAHYHHAKMAWEAHRVHPDHPKNLHDIAVRRERMAEGCMANAIGWASR